VLDRIHDELRRLVNAERVHDVRAMDGDRVHAQRELRGDLAIREPLANEPEDIELAFAERAVPLTLQAGCRRDARIDQAITDRTKKMQRTKLQGTRRSRVDLSRYCE